MYKYQKGLSSVQWVLVIFVVGVFALVATKITPIYVNNMYVQDALKFIAADNPNIKEMEKGEIKRKLQKYLTINSVGNEEAKSFKVRRYQDRLVVDSIYEVRVPIASNIDAVVYFKNQLDTANPDLCCEYLIEKWDESN